MRSEPSRPSLERMITGVSKVVVPADDQERAKQFWTRRTGFELRRDESYGDERWIEVSPPGRCSRITTEPSTRWVSGSEDAVTTTGHRCRAQ